MLPTHPLVQLIPLRVESAIRRLEASIWRELKPAKVSATEAGPRQLAWEEASGLPLHPVAPGESWGRLFDQRWCLARLPFEASDGDWFAWRDQGEATLYIGGQPYFGFDVAHRYCRLPPGVRELWVESNCVQSAIWHPEASGLGPEGSVFGGAFVCRRDDEAWHAFHDLKCLFELALNLRQQENVYLAPQVATAVIQPAVDKHSPAFRRMLRLMDEAVDALDHAGAAVARERLAAAYLELRCDTGLMRCVLAGHAHIDLVWLWPERVGELKTVHTFATVDRLMDEYPEFRFAHSQPAAYEAVRRRSPSLYGKVVERIRGGKWQAMGASYVESDTLIACGEALLRGFMLGQQFFRELNGRPSSLTWLPDVFGYSACLPQLMRLAGSKYFFTSKMTWNMVNRFPYSSFVWRGNDGSEVLTHVTQDCGYAACVEVPEIKNAMWGHQQGDLHQEFLMPTGFGDGGGGPTAEMCERARRLNSLPGMPAISWDGPETFFERLEPLRGRLPVYQGECYLEGHRGTFTTHGGLKAAFRGLERALQVSEAVSCVTGSRWDRDATWKRLVFSQFHDFIPGSSVWDVYLEGVPQLNRLACEELAKAAGALGQAEGTPSVFNSHAVPVRRWMTHPVSNQAVWVRLPALSGMPFAEAAGEEVVGVSVTEFSVSNGLAEFHLDGNGWLDRLMFCGQSVPLKGPAGQLVFYRDQPARYEAWDIDRQTLTGGSVCAAPASIEGFREGTHRAGFRVRRPVGEKSAAEVVFALEAGSPLLHISVNLDWRDPHALLKLVVPTGFAASHARFGIPYGSVLRPQVVNGPVSEAMWEVPFSRWLAVFDDGEREGLFAVTESKYGAAVREGAVGLSLVRSPLVPGHDGLRRIWNPKLSRVDGPSEYSDQGAQTIRLALGRYHAGLAREEHPASLADTLFTEPICYRGAALEPPLRALDGGETLIPAWAHPLDGDAWVLRLHEVAGQRGAVRVVPGSQWTVGICDAEGKAVAAMESEACVTFTPYQIVSVRFEQTEGGPAEVKNA